MLADSKKIKQLNPNLEVTRALPEDECESARILMREGLIEEAKKTLFRVLTQKPHYRLAKELLKEIERIEILELFKDSPRRAKSTPLEDIDALVEALDRDLDLGLAAELNLNSEKWLAIQGLTIKEHLDLGVAYFEMECFADALREFTKAGKKIRIEQTFLGETGISVAALIAQCLIKLNRPFEARAYLEPILIEPDLKHEDKIVLYYTIALAEENLQHTENAVNWFKKVAMLDPDYKDVNFKLRKKT